MGTGAIVMKPALLFALLLATNAGAQEIFEQLLGYKDSAGPRSLIVRVNYSEIEIVGTDRKDVLIKAWHKPEPAVSKDADARHLQIQAGPQLFTRLDGNVIRVEDVKNTKRIQLRIEVPREIRIVAWGSNAGPITIRDVSGLIEVENSNGGVVLDGISGSAIVSTSNASIVGSFRSVSPEFPMSFVTSNAVIDLTFPQSLSAKIQMETDSGDYYSDFKITQTRVTAPDQVPPGRGRFVGTIGGGGPLIRLQTDNNEIHLRSDTK
jgi:hypothetical protein